jgi:hypothetical protein
MTLHPEIEALVGILTEMSALLRRYDDEPWAARVDRCRDRIAQSDFYGVLQLRELYGGMGSLNDVILQLGGAMPVSDNERFDVLRAVAGESAAKFVRETADR